MFFSTYLNSLYRYGRLGGHSHCHGIEYRHGELENIKVLRHREYLIGGYGVSEKHVGHERKIQRRPLREDERG